MSHVPRSRQTGSPDNRSPDPISWRNPQLRGSRGDTATSATTMCGSVRARPRRNASATSMSAGVTDREVTCSVSTNTWRRSSSRTPTKMLFVAFEHVSRSGSAGRGHDSRAGEQRKWTTGPGRLQCQAMHRPLDLESEVLVVSPPSGCKSAQSQWPKSRETHSISV
jgi:hypothetical protein